MTQLSEVYIAGMKGDSYDLGIVSDEDMQTARASTNPAGAWANPEVRRDVGQQDAGCSTISRRKSQLTKSRAPFMGVEI